MKNSTRFLSVIAVAFGSLLAASCTGADELQGSLQIKGSDTMVNLCQAWAEAFMRSEERRVGKECRL